MAKSKANKYDESNIQHFEGLEGIRKKPAMYIGPTDSNGIWIITKEAADNATDEFLAGRNKAVHIIEAADKSIWVADEGSGIPVGKDKKTGMSTLKLVLTKTHAGGKFDAKAYSASIGTHGVGIKATNALSAFFEVYTFRDGKWWHTSYEKGVEKTPVKKSKAPVLPHGLKAKQGTILHFRPDASIFSKGAKFEIKQAVEWCKLTAYLNAGFTTQFTSAKGKSKKWCFKNGVKDYIAFKLEESKAEKLGKDILHYTADNIDLAVAFTNYDGTIMEGYTNSSKNSDGGVHLNAFYAALMKAIEPYKLKSHKFTSLDLRDGVIGIINYKIDSPQFSSQTKEKLVDTRVTKPCENTCYEALKDFFKKNKSLAQAVCKRADAVFKFKKEFQKSKKLEVNVKKASIAVSTKLAKVTGRAPAEECELFLVEGDSAGGTAKLARDNEFQAVFPLRGKPLNVMEAKMEAIEKNVEVASILAAIGVDLSSEDPIKKLPYGKIILLADADYDGKHITTLLLTVFWRFAPELFKEGKIYSVKSPEYIAKYKGKLVFGSTKSSVKKKLLKAGASQDTRVEIKHIKGWGEMESEDLEICAMSPKTRVLYKVAPPKTKEGAARFEQLMGKDATYRKKLMGVS